MKKGLIPVDRRLFNGEKQIERADWTDADSDKLEAYLIKLQADVDAPVAELEKVKKERGANWQTDQENHLKMVKEKQAKCKTKCDYFIDRMIPKAERKTLKREFKSQKHQVK